MTAALAAAALGSMAARAASAPVRRIGILAVSTEPQSVIAWRNELAKELGALGWRASSLDFVVVSPQAGGEPDFDRLAATLVASGVELIVSDGTPSTLALRRATAAIPIVASLNDPVAAGLARSLAVPGGNVTGLASQPGAEYYPKPLELIRAVVPGLARVGLFWPGNYRIPEQIETWARFASAQGLALERRPVDAFGDFVSGFAALRGRPAGAALLLNVAATLADWKAIVRAALEQRIPTISPYQSHTEAGGLMSYTLDYESEMERRAALVDKVLRGAEPARIPFELPTRTLLAVNLATAKALGLAIPQSILVRADKVYE